MRTCLRLFCFSAIAFAAAHLWGPPQALAQGSSTISGTVVDATQAVVGGAEISLVEKTSGLTRATVSNDAGNYVVPSLPTGNYTLTVKKPGFKSFKRSEIGLRLDQSARIDVELAVGGVADEIQVVATAPLLESDTSSQGQVIDTNTILNLPLNGRNYLQLGSLTAGAVPNKLSKDNTYSVNGNRGTQNSFVLDGVNNVSYLRGLDNRQRDIVRPSVDAIEEFKVLTASFSAEYGQSAGAVIIATVKSGTNQYHGSLYEFLRNQKLDALPYFQPRNSSVPAFIRNQYGVSGGGPIVRNKLFAFGSWERTNIRSETPQTATVPDLASRSGNFAGQKPIFDPATLHTNSAGQLVRDQFPGNMIPSIRFNPLMANLINYWPLPNASNGAVNYIYNPRQRDDMNRFDGKMDYNVTSAHSLFVRGSFSGENIALPKPLPPPAMSPGFRDVSSRGVAAGYTSVFSATLINEFRFGYAWVEVAEDALTPRDELGIRGSLAPNITSSTPNIRINGITLIGPNQNAPLSKTSMVTEFSDKISYQRGAHSFKFGGSFQILHPESFAALSGRGGVTYTGVFSQNPIDRGNTGVPFADFLLGIPDTASAGTSAMARERSRRYSLYAQDDWRVTRNLTLNLGIRYDLADPFWEADNRLTAFVLEPSSPAYNTLLPAGAPGWPRAMIDRDTNNIAPRLGFAYQPSKNWVIRGGGGIFYGQDEASGISQRLVFNPPSVINVSFPSDQVNISSALNLQTGFPVEQITAGNVQNPGVIAWNRNTPLPYISQWSLNVQRTLPGSIVVQAAYVGSSGVKLIGNRAVNQPVPGPGSINARRPVPGFGSITAEEPRVRSSYQGLNIQAEKRFSQGLSFLTAFTYGHSIDTMSAEAPGETDGGIAVNAQDPRNLNAEKASSDYDVRTRFTGSLVYLLPFGKEKGSGASELMNVLIRGWAVNSIATVQSGSPFTPLMSFDPSNTGTNERPNRLRDGSLPDSERSVQRYFDVSAFATPAQYTYGNSGRNILRGPGLVNVDLGIFRRFNLWEQKYVEFRGELFNSLNTPHLGIPNFRIGTPQAGQITSADTMRQVQLGIKVVF